MKWNKIKHNIQHSWHWHLRRRGERRWHWESIWRNDGYLSQIWQKINLQFQDAEWTLNRINPKTPVPRYVIIKLLKTKQHAKSWNHGERHDGYFRQGGVGGGERQNQWHHISHQKPPPWPGGSAVLFLSAEGQEPLTQGSIPRDHIFVAQRGNKGILRCRTTERICHQQSKFSKGIPLNRK